MMRSDTRVSCATTGIPADGLCWGEILTVDLDRDGLFLVHASRRKLAPPPVGLGQPRNRPEGGLDFVLDALTPAWNPTHYEIAFKTDILGRVSDTS